MAELSKEQKADIDKAMQAFHGWAESMNLTLTEDEIADKYAELVQEVTGEVAIIDAGSRELESWDEVAEAMATGQVEVIDDYQKLDDKRQLVNVPFFVNRFWFTTDADSGRQYATMRILTSRPINTGAGATQKVVITDGSTGIFRQLRLYAQKQQKSGGFIVRNGLRASEYVQDTSEGRVDAKTFYLT